MTQTKKTCTNCGNSKSLDEFPRDARTPDGHKYRCKTCHNEAAQHYRDTNRDKVRAADRRWIAANPDKIRAKHAANPQKNREWNRTSAARAKAAVFAHYGTWCACCGTTGRLTIDHVNGDGAEHRRQMGGGGSRLYRWLVVNNFPAGFQTLCLRCNKAKGRSKRCPLSHPGPSAEAVAR